MAKWTFTERYDAKNLELSFTWNWAHCHPPSPLLATEALHSTLVDVAVREPAPVAASHPARLMIIGAFPDGVVRLPQATT